MKRQVFSTVIALTLPTHLAFTGPMSRAPEQASDPPPIPSILESPTVADSTTLLDDVIERRSRELDGPPPSTPDQRVVHDARRGVRRITVELAILGRERGDASIIAGFHAIRLDATMRSIDRLLESLARPGTMVGDPPSPLPESDRVSAIARLEAFNRTGLDLLRRSDTGTVKGLDETLATILAPLRDVFGLLIGRPLQSRWPIGTESPAGGPPADGDVDGPPIDARVAAMLDAVHTDPSDASFDVTILERMLSATPFDPEDPESTATWRRVAEVLDCIQVDQADDRPLATSTLRSARRDALVRRRAALQDLQQAMETADELTASDLPADELAAIHRATRSSRAVRHLDEIAVGLSRLHPAATRKVGRFVGSLGRESGDPRERERTLESIDRLLVDLERFANVDFDRRLRTPDISTIELVGGRAEALSEVMSTTRHAWVDAVIDGQTEGHSIDAMDRMTRLGTLLEHLVALVPTDGVPILDLDRCDRWGGWYVDSKMLGWSARTLFPGVHLAVGSAIAGDPDRFERELEMLESQSPMVRLATVIARRTEKTMASLPGEGIATIAAAAIPPTASAWGVNQRVALAAACLGMAELVSLRSESNMNDTEMRHRLADAVATACDDLLAELNTDGPVGKESRP